MPVKLNGEYYGIAEAARALGRTEGRIRQMIRWKEMNAVEISERVWLVSDKEIQRILKGRGEVAAN